MNPRTTAADVYWCRLSHVGRHLDGGREKPITLTHKLSSPEDAENNKLPFLVSAVHVQEDGSLNFTENKPISALLFRSTNCLSSELYTIMLRRFPLNANGTEQNETEEHQDETWKAVDTRTGPVSSQSGNLENRKESENRGKKKNDVLCCGRIV